MLALQVIEGHDRLGIATVQKMGIRCGGRFYLPISMECLDGGASGASGASGSLAGAALGAITFGAAGAVVGSLVDRRGRTAVKIQTTDGSDMICTVASDEFPGLYVEVQRLIALAATGYVPPEPARVKAEHILLGPFYFLKFGPGWFIAAISVTIMTFGIGWLLTPGIAPYLDLRRKRKSPSPTPANKAFAPSGSKFIRAEGDLLPPQEGGASAP